MGRTIDADALIARWIDDASHMVDPIAKMFTYGAINDVQREPTVVVPQWIPVTERLPEEKDAGRVLKKLGTSKRSEYVIATVDVKGERMTVTACTYDGKWDWNMKYAFPDYKIIAWMPLPEPFNG